MDRFGEVKRRYAGEWSRYALHISVMPFSCLLISFYTRNNTHSHIHSSALSLSLVAPGSPLLISSRWLVQHRTLISTLRFPCSMITRAKCTRLRLVKHTQAWDESPSLNTPWKCFTQEGESYQGLPLSNVSILRFKEVAVTHLDETTIWPLPNAWAHRHPWLVSVTCDW